MKQTKYYQIFFNALEIIFIVSLCAVFSKSAYDAVKRPGLIPKWDEASHGLDTLAFAEAIKHFSIADFFGQVWLSDYWPPAFPLAASLIALPTDYHWSSLRLIVTGVACGCLCLLYLCLRPFSRPSIGALAATVAAFFLASSPIFQTYGTLVMLEIPGIFVILLGLLCLRHYFASKNSKWLKAVAVVSGIIFFTKFNYFLMWFIPLTLFFMVENVSAVFDILIWLKKSVLKINRRSLFFYFVCSYAAILALIHFSGGYAGQVGPFYLELKEIWGNPIYILGFVVGVKCMITDWDGVKNFSLSVWDCPYPWQPFVRFTLFPILLWLVNPRFFANFLNSIINGSTRSSWMQMLTFYPKALVYEYGTQPIYGILLGIALLSNITILFFLIKIRKVAEHRFFVFVILLTSLNFMMVVVHPNYISRYLLTVYPLFCLQLGLLLQLIGVQLKSLPLRLIYGFILVVSSIFLARNLTFELSSQAWALNLDRESGEIRTQALGEAICNLSIGKKTSVIGYNASLSPDTVAWICKIGAPDRFLQDMPKTLTRFRLDPDRTSAEDVFKSPALERILWINYHNQIEFHKNNVLYFAHLDSLRKELIKSAYQLEKTVEIDTYTVEVFKK